MNDMIPVRNLETGEVGLIPRRWYEHSVINPGILEEVEPGTKSMWEGMWRSRVTPLSIEAPTPEAQEASEEDED